MSTDSTTDSWVTYSNRSKETLWDIGDNDANEEDEAVKPLVLQYESQYEKYHRHGQSIQRHNDDKLIEFSG